MQAEPAPAQQATAASRDISWERSQVTTEERERLLGQKAVTLWVTGLPSSGKSTLAHALERRLVDASRACYVIDGDNVRHGLNRDLGFSPAERRENIRRVAEVARLMNDAGLAVIAALVSPAEADREMARSIVGAPFREVYLSTSIEVCEARDPKGLYAKARRGELASFTGVGASYEPPRSPDLSLDTGALSIGECVERLLALAAPVDR